MIIGIGIDQVAIKRFYSWHETYASQLHKIFSPTELSYCMQASSNQQRAERFAVRFAAREAFFKAYTSACNLVYERKGAGLLRVLALMSVERTPDGMPYLKVDWDNLLEPTDARPKIHLSLSHTHDLASAYVILEQL
jgi:phosphopantetheine--protein transferase-like protein